MGPELARVRQALARRLAPNSAGPGKPWEAGPLSQWPLTRSQKRIQRPPTRCVPIKTDDQLDLQALHRVRSRLIGDRTAVINQLRGFLLEHGIAVRQGHRFLRQQLPEL